MASIAFTDSIGDAVLTNGMPISKFTNWTPLTRPVGDVATRKSDGLRMMFTERTDYAASFELRNIPMKEVVSEHGLILNDSPMVFGGSEWDRSQVTVAIGLTAPDGTATAPQLTATADGNDSLTQDLTLNTARARLVLEIRESSAGGSGIILGLQDLDAGGAPTGHVNSFNFTNGAYTTSGSIPVVVTVVPIFVPLATTWWRVTLDYTTLIPGNDHRIRLGWASGTTGQAYGLYRAELYGLQRNVEIADRLIAHLMGGGTCSVTTDDRDGNTYDTCGLAPGTEPSLTLADDQLLEYTLSLALINLDASPSPMVCRYA